MCTKIRSKHIICAILYTDRDITKTGWNAPTQEDVKDIETGYNSCNLDVLLTFRSRFYIHIFQ
jgi:hypothetical protein